MTDNWDSYFCTVDDHPASVVVNLALADSAPFPEYPVLGYVGIELLDPNEQGFPEPDEEERLARMEDALLDAFDAEAAGRCAGHCLSNGRLDVFFYLRDGDAFSDKVKDALAQYDSHDWEAGTHGDPDWDVYWAFLFPDELTMLHIQNRRGKDRLAELGEDPEQVRTVRHWVDFSDREDAEAFGRSAMEQGYAVEAISPVLDEDGDNACGEGENSSAKSSSAAPQFWQVSLSRLDAPETIDEPTRVLVSMAKERGGVYRGWDCSVAESEAS